MRDLAETSMTNTKNTNTQQSQGDASSSRNDEWRKVQLENEELRRKIEQLESVVHAKSFDIAHIKAIVEPFSGEGTLRVETWIGKLEEAFRVLKLNKAQQLVAVCALLTETAAVFRGTVQFKDYDDFKAKLLEEFQGHQQCSDEGIVQKLRSHKLKGVNVLKYVLEMITIAKGHNIAEVDLVDIIIDGLQDTSHVVVMLYGAKTIAELKSLLPRYNKRRDNATIGYTSNTTSKSTDKYF
ncbi:uncharacterized protein LOC128301273 [Anopheles moucheti]|uniref:uncharacterized protein LOC128301273 n=1 Tax=Anopheles moucheti TaxID=186751 RepID=UPI0022F0EC5E|nr:uncharacterized protein LOC128301273 [Anopheles moucheti]XP_052893625.1 uncharacterized protein LOC128301273 [Anopheles moucheti]